MSTSKQLARKIRQAIALKQAEVIASNITHHVVVLPSHGEAEIENYNPNHLYIITE